MAKQMNHGFRKLFVEAVVLCLWGVHAANGQTTARKAEQEDIGQAQRAVLASLAIATSSSGARLCVLTPVACVGPDKLELGMSLIAARNTSASLQALASLVRFKLDGAYSEDYDDLFLAKGKAVAPFLSSLSPQVLHEQCVKEFAELVHKSGSALGDTSDSRVCRSEEAIKADVRSTVEAIREGRKPEAE
jgi:hypothetical protein